MRQNLWQQLFPLFLTLVTFAALTVLLFFFIHVLNLFPLQDKIDPHLHLADILVGLTIYLKTSIDFALFIGNLMHTYPGWKNRIGIEIGTALGNAAGTFLVLFIWTFFKEVPLLLVVMIILAALVLFQMAEDGFSEYFDHPTLPQRANNAILLFARLIHKVNRVFHPILSFVLPHVSLRDSKTRGFWGLLLFSFSIINVFGFATGVFLGHMLLNLSLFASPKITTRIVRQPVVTVIGGFVFVGLALWGFYEAFHALLLVFH